MPDSLYSICCIFLFLLHLSADVVVHDKETEMFSSFLIWTSVVLCNEFIVHVVIVFFFSRLTSPLGFYVLIFATDLFVCVFFFYINFLAHTQKKKHKHMSGVQKINMLQSKAQNVISMFDLSYYFNIVYLI